MEDLLKHLHTLQWKLQTADVSTPEEDAALAEAIRRLTGPDADAAKDEDARRDERPE